MERVGRGKERGARGITDRWDEGACLEEERDEAELSHGGVALHARDAHAGERVQESIGDALHPRRDIVAE